MERLSEEPHIAIILVNWNGKKDTLECLASLEKVEYSRFFTVVVDNGSHDGSVKSIRQAFPKIKILETKKNLGFAGGNNVGIEYALRKGADAVFLLNNDTTVAHNLLHAFVSAMRQRPNGGIFGAKIYRYSEPNIIDHLGGKWNPEKAEFDSLAWNCKEDYQSYEVMESVDYACGCAIFIRKEVFTTIGLLEPKFFLLWEESDFCFQARRSGFSTWTVPQAKVWHKVSASFTGGKPQMHYFWWRNRLLWVERNLSRKEKFSIYRRVLLREILHIYKLRFLKAVQYSFSPSEKRKAKLLRYKAGCRGIRDYCFRRFGNHY